MCGYEHVEEQTLGKIVPRFSTKVGVKQNTEVYSIVKSFSLNSTNLRNMPIIIDMNTCIFINKSEVQMLKGVEFQISSKLPQTLLMNQTPLYSPYSCVPS